MANVGLTITEGVANDGSAYKSPSKRNIGVLGQFIRGGAFKPTKITALEDFNVIFGGQSSSFYGPGVVRSIFKEADNAPVTLYVARVVGSGSVVASGSTTLRENVTMSVKAGYKGSEDPGAWANDVKVTLYSFGSKVKDNYTLVVEYKDAKETYSYPTLSEIQVAVNKVSKYVILEFSAEITTKTEIVSGSGNVTATTSSNKVTFSSAIGSDVKVGTTLYIGSGDDQKLLGTILSVDSQTQVTLTSKALTAAAGVAYKYRKDYEWTATLANGVDGEVTEADFYPESSIDNPKGFACFDGYDVQILCHTEFHSLSLEKKFNAYLADWGSPIGVINLPLNADEGTAELYALELQTNQRSFLAGAYLGWCKVPDDNGDLQLIPAIGPILGAAYVRTPYLSGDFIHIPPGGTDSLFKYVAEVTPARLTQPAINKCVQQFSCNIIQYIENTGYYVGSSRTYSSNPLYSSIHIRQQTSYYVRSLFSKLRYLEQKPNTPELKRQALVDLYSFFKEEYDNGALERSVDFDTAYKGICDLSNNPLGQDRKIINIDVLWIPTECTESVQLSLKRNDGVLNVTEA